MASHLCPGLPKSRTSCSRPSLLLLCAPQAGDVTSGLPFLSPMALRHHPVLPHSKDVSRASQHITHCPDRGPDCMAAGWWGKVCFTPGRLGATTVGSPFHTVWCALCSAASLRDSKLSCLHLGSQDGSGPMGRCRAWAAHWLVPRARPGRPFHPSRRSHGAEK